MLCIPSCLNSLPVAAEFLQAIWPWARGKQAVEFISNHREATKLSREIEKKIQGNTESCPQQITIGRAPVKCSTRTRTHGTAARPRLERREQPRANVFQGKTAFSTMRLRVWRAWSAYGRGSRAGSSIRVAIRGSWPRRFQAQHAAACPLAAACRMRPVSCTPDATRRDVILCSSGWSSRQAGGVVAGAPLRAAFMACVPAACTLQRAGRRAVLLRGIQERSSGSDVLAPQRRVSKRICCLV